MNTKQWAEKLEKLPEGNWKMKVALGLEGELELSFQKFRDFPFKGGFTSKASSIGADALITRDTSKRYSPKFSSAVIYIDNFPDLIPSCQRTVSLFFKDRDGNQEIKANPQIVSVTLS